MLVSHSTRRPTRPWAVLPLLLLPALLTSMDISILFVASPALTEALAPTTTQWLWMMDVYGFVMAGLLITMGGLGDRIGRKRLLLAGATLFGVASAAIALARTPEMFIAARVLLGVAAATLAPSTLSLIRAVFEDEDERRKAVGAWTVAFTGGAVAGPIVGGLLLEHFWWGSVFLINVPVMVALLVAGPFLVPESRRPGAAGFDLPGAAASLIAVVAVIFAGKRIVEDGVDGPALLAAALGLAFAVAFAVRQRRAAHPLIDLALFGRASFRAAVAANTAAAFAVAGLGLLAFTFMQTVHGLSAFGSALWALPTFAGTMLGAVAASLLGSRAGSGRLLAAGLVIGSAGFAVLGQIGPGTALQVFLAGYTVLAFGIGIVGTVANSLILSTAAPERAGAAAGVSETSHELGAAMGIAVLGTVAAAVYRDGMGADAPPAAETVAGAAAAAEALPAGAGERLREAAFAAFTSSVNTAAWTGAALLAVVAVAAGFSLRGRR